jgi:hypothetical protein
MALPKFFEWINEQDGVPTQANQMKPGGSTEMAGNPHSPPALGNVASGNDQKEQQEEEEAKHISQSLMTMLDRLMPKLSKLKNKQAGMEVVGMILDKIHTALPQITQAALMKLVKGTMQQDQAPPQPSPHLPPPQQQ